MLLYQSILVGKEKKYNVELSRSRIGWARFPFFFHSLCIRQSFSIYLISFFEIYTFLICCQPIWSIWSLGWVSVAQPQHTHTHTHIGKSHSHISFVFILFDQTHSDKVSEWVSEQVSWVELNRSFHMEHIPCPVEWSILHRVSSHWVLTRVSVQFGRFDSVSVWSINSFHCLKW